MNIRKLQKTIEEDKTDLEDINHLCEDYRISIEQNEIMLTEVILILLDMAHSLKNSNSFKKC